MLEKIKNDIFKEFVILREKSWFALYISPF